MSELAARAARLRRAILVPSIVLGVVGGIAGYLVIREVQFTFFQLQLPWVSGLLGCFPPLAGAFRLGRLAGNAVVAKRAPAWLEAATRRHGLPSHALDDYLPIL